MDFKDGDHVRVVVEGHYRAGLSSPVDYVGIDYALDGVYVTDKFVKSVEKITPPLPPLPTTPGSVVATGDFRDVFWVLAEDGDWFGRGAQNGKPMSYSPNRIGSFRLVFDAGAPRD